MVVTVTGFVGTPRPRASHRSLVVLPVAGSALPGTGRLYVSAHDEILLQTLLLSSGMTMDMVGWLVVLIQAAM